MPLIAGKPALVRLYVDTGGVSVASVTAELHGTNAQGNPLPGSPLLAGNRCASLNTSGPDRYNLNQTLNFELPDEWLQAGRTTLHAVVNPERTVPETDHANNEVEATARYTGQPPICIKTYRVRTTNGHNNDLRVPTNMMRAEGDGIRAQILALIPTDTIHYFPQSNLLEEYEFPFSYGPYEM